MLASNAGVGAARKTSSLLAELLVEGLAGDRRRLDDVGDRHRRIAPGPRQLGHRREDPLAVLAGDGLGRDRAAAAREPAAAARAKAAGPPPTRPAPSSAPVLRGKPRDVAGHGIGVHPGEEVVAEVGEAGGFAAEGANQ